jgi:hypothetical protein
METETKGKRKSRRQKVDGDSFYLGLRQSNSISPPELTGNSPQESMLITSPHLSTTFGYSYSQRGFSPVMKVPRMLPTVSNGFSRVRLPNSSLAASRLLEMIPLNSSFILKARV